MKVQRIATHPRMDNKFMMTIDILSHYASMVIILCIIINPIAMYIVFGIIIVFRSQSGTLQGIHFRVHLLVAICSWRCLNWGSGSDSRSRSSKKFNVFILLVWLTINEDDYALFTILKDWLISLLGRVLN